MKLYYDNKQCDDQARYPACRPYPYRRYCDYGKDYDRECDYDRKGKDYDKEHDYDKKCRCECVECEECEDKHQYRHCCPKNPCPYPILFECAAGTGASIDQTITGSGASSGGTVYSFAPKSLGCLTIDTTCLKNPVVKFDFCSTIDYRVNKDTDPTARVKLVFGLFKTCDDGAEVPCGNWTYIADLAKFEKIRTTFNFCHCECNGCPGCCRYTVKLIEARNEDDYVQVEVCDVTLSAIAKAGC